MRKLAHLLLERSFLLFGRAESVGNFTHFRVHARACDNSFAAAVNDCRTAVKHIFSVAEGNIL